MGTADAAGMGGVKNFPTRPTSAGSRLLHKRYPNLVDSFRSRTRTGIGGPLTLPIVVYIITVNSVFGLIAGYLYWRKGLEAAITAS